MKCYQILSKSLLAASVALGLSVAAAQALPPVSKVIKVDPNIKGTTAEAALKHGMKVVVKLKDKSRVLGTVVWADQANDYMLIRTKPGAAPTKIRGKDVDDVERIRLTSASGNFVPDQPEIHQVALFNGSLKTVRYFAPTLSPGERTELAELETAENQAERLQYMMGQTLDTLRGEVQMSRERQMAAAAQSQIITTQMSWGASFIPYYSMPLSGYYPLYYGPAGIGGQSPPTIVSLDALMNKEKSLESEMAKVRRNLSLTRSHGLYEGDELVAVLPASGNRIAPAVDSGKQ